MAGVRPVGKTSSVDKKTRVLAGEQPERLELFQLA